MIKTLTKSEMLERWTTIRAGEPQRLDCTVSRLDGLDLSAVYEAEMRAWYLDLLDSADESLLAPEDLAEEATVSEAQGLTLVTFPAGVRRVLRLRFSGWGAPVAPEATPAKVTLSAANPFCRRPLAAKVAPNVVAVAGARGELVAADCIVDRGPQAYIFDDKALQRLFTN